MKKAFRYIRHRVCRTIYYADWCPMENRKNYKKLILDFFACTIFATTSAAFFFILLTLA